MSFHSPDRESAHPEHVDAVLSALDSMATGPGPPCETARVVAIDGRSGSGKTVLAGAVATELGAPLVHMDQLYPGWDGLAAGVDSLVEHVLAPLARGERVAYPVWDWHEDRWNGQIELPSAPVVIVEGCGSSVGPAREYAAVRVWLEAPREERRRRGLARDGGTFAPHWDRWAAQEDALFTRDDTAARADLVLRTG